MKIRVLTSIPEMFVQVGNTYELDGYHKIIDDQFHLCMGHGVYVVIPKEDYEIVEEHGQGD
jgi:hypothetical protein